MSSIYFSGNYKRYKEHNNIVWQSVSPATKHYFPTYSSPLAVLFLQWWTRALHFTLWQLCTAFQNVACLSLCCHCWNTPPTASLCTYPLFGLHKHSESIDECQWVPFFFCMEEFSDTPLLHPHFHARRHFVRLLCCRLSQGNNM